MKRIIGLAVALAAFSGSGAQGAALHPPIVSPGGGIVGTDSDCSTTVQVELFAHYIDRAGVTKNQLLTTTTSTCGGSVSPTQQTVARLFKADGTEIGTSRNCGSAVVCQRYDWVSGASGERFVAAGASILTLPAGTAAWIRCLDFNVPGHLQAGHCSLRSDTKRAALSAYADWLLV